jgi:metal-responsive CopG/Arc/MetJ family transcriptional regulator
MTMKKKLFVRPVSVNLSEEVFKQIYDIAEKEEISLSDYIREAIQEKLERANVKFGYESIY